VGGLCGLSAGAIDKGANTGKITGTGNNVGGLCGTAYMISTSSNRGVVSGAENIGGVAGFLSPDGKITSGDNTGSVVGAKAAGGVVGRAAGPGVITACNNEGNVSVPLTGTREWTGGVAGFAGDTVVMVANRNAGTVVGDTGVGGVAGRIENGSTIIASYNAGTVSGSIFAGGVCGDNSGGSVSACYNIGLLLGQNPGGVTGQASSSVLGSSDNFYLLPWSDNDGAKPFGDGTGGSGWPANAYGNEWGVGGSGTAGQYWNTLGQWAAPRVYPKLYWEK
jgi:hypothetical protein